MKKSVVIILVLALVLGFASTAAADVSPFSDVPQGNWAYDAVAKLQSEGIINGYAGTHQFEGKNLMTRYEMAQIVANAITKEENANAEQKALIEKLKTEFAAELNDLGVRVAKLEANQVKLQFNGDFKNRITDYVPEASGIDKHYDQIRLRLGALATVDDNTTFGLRIVSVDPLQNPLGNQGLPTNSTWLKMGGAVYSSTTASITTNNNMALDRFWGTTKIGNATVSLGRQQFLVGITSGIVDAGAFSYDGLKLTDKMGPVNAMAQWGVIVNNIDFGDLEFQIKPSNALQYGFGYFDVRNDGGGSNAAAPFR